MIIDKKYMILFWIIGLILFTFYCIFRIKYVIDKTENFNPTLAVPTNTLAVPTNNVWITKPQTTMNSNNIIAYINNVQSTKSITDIPGCENMYDDNINVQKLGYNNCNNAYSDYVSKGLNVKNKYGKTQALVDICPVSCRSTQYDLCLDSLFHKYSDNTIILNGINTDMTNSINNRINKRSDALYNIQKIMNPFIYSKSQKGFHNKMLVDGNIAKYPYETLGLIDKYYKNRYGESIETFTSDSKNSSESFTNVIDPKLEKIFFGKFKPLTGQLLAFDDVIFTIEYDSSYTPIPTAKGKNNVSSKPTATEYDVGKSLNTNAVPVYFTISNDDIYLSYTITKLDNYKLQSNAIKIILYEKDIIHQSDDNNIIDPLLQVLGINENSSLIIIYDEYVSTEKIKHKTYRLVNDSLDTILTLEKI